MAIQLVGLKTQMDRTLSVVSCKFCFVYLMSTAVVGFYFILAYARKKIAWHVLKCKDLFDFFLPYQHLTLINVTY